MKARDVRTANRKIADLPDGTCYLIRKLRQIDFVSRGLIGAAVSGKEQGQISAEDIRRYVEDNPTEALDANRRTIVTAGTLGIAEAIEDPQGESVPFKEALDDKNRGQAGRVHWGDRWWFVEPVLIVDHPTDIDDELYYLDLGPQFQWLNDAISGFSRMTKEAADAQESFRGDVRAVVARDGEGIPPATARTA